MGWFDEPGESEPAARHALRIARKLALPLTAKSRTKAEYAAHNRRVGLFLFCVYAVLVMPILIGLMLEGGQQNREIFRVAFPFSLLGGLLIYGAMRWRMRRGGDYRNPGIAVDVGADGIIVRGAAGAYGMRWHEIDATLNWVSVKNGVRFIGLRLQSPLGLIDLGEENYRHGRNAAALIVRGLHDDYHARQKAKVERIG